jgi:nickel-type superoxide dismutase maturation protease
MPEMKKRGDAEARPPRRAGRRSVRLLLFGAVGLAAVFARVVVSGDSMLPTLEQGDRLLVLRFGHRRGLRLGDLVTVRDPTDDGRGAVLVKRVGDVDRESVELTGDNPEASTDSRSFGRVPLASVTGKVLYRYAPAERAGVVH